MKTKPYFSVIIPTHNSEGFIERTLNSVLLQDYSNYEVVVSDDGSNDRTVEIVKSIFSRRNSLNLIILTNEHHGPGAARNKGVLSARGEWIAFLDSDDVWHREKLSTVVRHILNRPFVDLWCHSETVRLKNRMIALDYYRWFNSNIDPFISLYVRNALSTSAVTVRTECLKRVGLFDESLLSAQDYDLWLRLSNGSRIDFIKQPLGEYFVRENSISSDPLLRLTCLLTIGDKYFDILKQKTRFCSFYRLMFKSRAFLDAGNRSLKQGNYRDGIGYLAKGIFYLPLNVGRFAPIFESLNRH